MVRLAVACIAIAGATFVAPPFARASPIGSAQLGSRKSVLPYDSKSFGSAAVGRRSIFGGPSSGTPASMGGAPWTSPRQGGLDMQRSQQRGPPPARFGLFGGDEPELGSPAWYKQRDSICDGPGKSCAEDGSVCTEILTRNEYTYQPKFWGPFQDPNEPGKREYFTYWEIAFPFPSLEFFKVWEQPTFWEPADSWCLDLKNFAKLVNKVGCGNDLILRCGALSVNSIMAKWPQSMEGDVNLGPAKECVKSKCVPTPAEAATLLRGNAIHIRTIAAVGGIAGAVFAAIAVLRRRTAQVSVFPLLG